LATRIFLRPDWCKNIFLFGNLGAGKTTFLRALGKKIGINGIKSPTFLGIANYKIPGKKIFLAHADFFQKKVSAKFLPEILENLEKNFFAAEWSENFPKKFLPNNRIEIRISIPKKITEKNKFERTVEIIFFDSSKGDEKKIQEIIKKWQPPKHVFSHCVGVASVANFLAEKLEKAGIPLDRDLIIFGGILHDLVRICNFPELDFARFPEKITEKKKQKWQKIHQKFNKMHHSVAAAKILKAEKLFSLSEVVARHRNNSIFGDEMVAEEKCVFLADKYVLHDKIVDLKTRLQDSKKRHLGWESKKFLQFSKKIKQFEKDFWKMAQIKSGEISEKNPKISKNLENYWKKFWVKD